MKRAEEREKERSASGSAADALSRSAFGFAISNSLFFAFVPLWRVLERGGEAAALVYSSTRHSAICKKFFFGIEKYNKILLAFVRDLEYNKTINFEV